MIKFRAKLQQLCRSNPVAEIMYIARTQSDNQPFANWYVAQDSTSNFTGLRNRLQSKAVAPFTNMV